jgi:hypothetical protein
LASNVIRIAALETNGIISNSSGITSIIQGDIVYASADSTLSRLPLGTANKVLKSDGTNVVWGAASPWVTLGNDISYSTGNVTIGGVASVVNQNYNSLVNIPTSSRVSGWRNYTFGNITLPATWSNTNFQFKATVNGTLDGIPTGEYVSITMKKQGTGTQPSAALNFNPQNQSSGITSGGGKVYYTNVVQTNTTIADGSFSAGDVVDIYMTIYVTYWDSLSIAVEIDYGVAAFFVADSTNSRVGIGTTTPGYDLDVLGDINFTGALTQNGTTYGGGGSGSSPWVTSGNDISYSTGNVAVNTNTLFVATDAAGRVGIGTSSPMTALHVSSGTAGDCRLVLEADTDNNNEGDNPRIEFWQDGAIQESAIGMTSNRLNLWNSVGSGGISFHTNSVDGWTNAIERMTIDPDGNVAVDTNTFFVDSVNDRVGIGTTTPGYDLDVAGDIYSTGNITAYSDKRAKENIEKIENALDKVCTLGGYTYTMKGQKYTGLIAQEVLEVLPEAVTGSEETNYALAYGNMMGLIVEAIKELKQKIG